MEGDTDNSSLHLKLKIKDPSLLYNEVPSEDDQISRNIGNPPTMVIDDVISESNEYCPNIPEYELKELDIKVNVSDLIKKEPDGDPVIACETDPLETKPDVNLILENNLERNILFEDINIKDEKCLIEFEEHSLKEESSSTNYAEINSSVESSSNSPCEKVVEESNTDDKAVPLIDLDSEKSISDIASKSNLPSTSKISIVHPLVNAGISDGKETTNPVENEQDKSNDNDGLKSQSDVSTPGTILQYNEEVPTPEDADVHLISKATILPFWSVNKAIERTAASEEIVKKSIELKKQSVKSSKKEAVTVEEKKTNSDVQGSNSARPSPPVNAVKPLVNAAAGQVTDSIYVNYNIKNVDIAVLSRSETYRGIFMIGDERYDCIGKSNALLGGKHPLCIMTRPGLNLDGTVRLVEKYVTPLLPKTGKVKQFSKLLIVCTIGWNDIIKTKEVKGARIKVTPKYRIDSFADELDKKMVQTYDKIVACLRNSRAEVVFSHAWPVNILLYEKHINNRSAVMLTSAQEKELSSLSELVLQKIKEFNCKMSKKLYCVSSSIPFNKTDDPSVHWNTSFDSYNLRNGILPAFLDSELVHKRMMQLYEIYVRVTDKDSKFGCLYFIGDNYIQNTFTHWNKSGNVDPYLIMSNQFSVKNIQSTVMHYCKNDDIVVYTPSRSSIIKYKTFDGCFMHDKIEYPVVNEKFTTNKFISQLISVVKCRDVNSVLNQIKLCIGSVIYVDLIEKSRTFIMEHFKTSQHCDADTKMKSILASLNKVRNSFVSLNKHIEHACVIADIPFMNLNCENSNEITTKVLGHIDSYKFFSRSNAKHRLSMKYRKPLININFLSCVDLEGPEDVPEEDFSGDSFLEWSWKRNESSDKTTGSSFSINPPDVFTVDNKVKSKSIRIPKSQGSTHRDKRLTQHSEYPRGDVGPSGYTDSVRKRARHCDDWSDFDYSRNKYQRYNESELDHYQPSGRHPEEYYDRNAYYRQHYSESSRQYPEDYINPNLYQTINDERLAKLKDCLSMLKQGESSNSSNICNLPYDETSEAVSINEPGSYRKRILSSDDEFSEPSAKRSANGTSFIDIETGDCSKGTHKIDLEDQPIESSLNEATASQTASLPNCDYIQFPVDLDVNTEILKRISENTSIASCPSKQRTFNKLVTDFTVSREKFILEPTIHHQYQNGIAKYVSYKYAQTLINEEYVSWEDYWKNHLSFVMLEEFKDKVKELEQRVEVDEPKIPKKKICHIHTDKPAAIISELITMKDKLGVLSSVLPIIHTKMLHAQKNKKNPLDVITDSHMKVFEFLQTKLEKDSETANPLQRSLLTSCFESLSHLIYLVHLNRKARINVVSALTYLIGNDSELKEVINSFANIECEEDYGTVLHLVKKMHENMRLTDVKENDVVQEESKE